MEKRRKTKQIIGGQFPSNSSQNMKTSVQQNSSIKRRAAHIQSQQRPLLKMEMPPSENNLIERGMRRRQRAVGHSRTRSAAPKRGGRKENDGLEYKRRFASAENRPQNLAPASIGTDLDEEEAAAQLRRLPSLLARLETAMHFWDIARPSPSIPGRKEGGNGAEFSLMSPLDGRIPDNYGLLLDSDLPPMDRQLAAIRQNLVQLRQFGFSQPTAEYFQHFHRRPFPIGPSNQPQIGQTFGGILRANLGETTASPPPPTLAQIRARLLNMEFHVEKRIRELTMERRKWDGGGMNAKNGGLAHSKGRGAWQMPALGKRQAAEEMLKRPIEAQPVPPPTHNALHSQSKSNPLANIRPTQMDAFRRPSEANYEFLPKEPFLPAATAPTFEEPTIRPLVFGSIANLNEPETGKEMEKAGEEKLAEEIVKNDERHKMDGAAENAISAVEGQAHQQQGEDVNFQRMLQVLKNPRRFDLSSSSSAADEDIDKAGLSKTTTTGLALANSQHNLAPSSSQPPAILSSSSFGAAFSSINDNDLIGQKKGGGGGGSDSDSDFFK